MVEATGPQTGQPAAGGAQRRRSWLGPDTEAAGTRQTATAPREPRARWPAISAGQDGAGSKPRSGRPENGAE